MEEGDYFAIETFGSTGRGRVVENVRTANSFRSRSFDENLLGRVFALCKNHGCTSSTTPVRQTSAGCAVLNYHTKFDVGEIIT